MKRCVATTIVILLFITAARGADDDPILRTVDGESWKAKLQSIDSNWQFTFRGEGKSRVVPADELVVWGRYCDQDRGSQILLADESVLVADIIGLNDGTLGIYSDLFGERQLPLSLVRGVILQPPSDPIRRDKLLRRIQSAESGTDRLLLDNGDTVTGSLTGYKPADSDGKDDHVAFVTQGRDITTPVGQIVAIIFNPALLEPPAARRFQVCMGTDNGSLLRVIRFESREGFVEMYLAGNVRLFTEIDVLLDALNYVSPRSDQIVYLSDLPAVGFKHVPLLRRQWPLGIDRSTSGGRLRVKDAVYLKGLGMHSTSRVAFDLNGRYDRFAAELAIDRSAGQKGSVICRVYLNDDSGQWRRAYASPILRGGGAPVSMSVDVRGARRMALIVEPADRGTVSDRADWLDARLIIAPVD